MQQFHPNSDQIKYRIRAMALDEGFSACGFANARMVDSAHGKRYANWIDNEYHAQMAYMNQHNDKRMNPELLFPGLKTIVSFAANYFSPENQAFDKSIRISAYALGKDYHYVLKDKMRRIAETINSEFPDIKYRVFTDSAPVLEHYWAKVCGLGNLGKNSCIILPRKGSFFFLSELFLNVALPPDEPYERDMCGKCTRCIDACPTSAIVQPGIIDSNRCISYLTIEKKDALESSESFQNSGYFFGCDICQLVCPHNIKFAARSLIPEFAPREELSGKSASDWQKLTKQEYKRLFVKSGSPVARVKYEKLMDNISKVFHRQ